MTTIKPTHKILPVHGFTLIETLIALSVLAIITVSINLTAKNIFTTYSKVTHEIAVKNLLNDKLEQLAAIDPALLDDNYDSIETEIIINNVEYVRTVDISITKDNLRSITINARTANSSVKAEANIEYYVAANSLVE